MRGMIFQFLLVLIFTLQLQNFVSGETFYVRIHQSDGEPHPELLKLQPEVQGCIILAQEKLSNFRGFLNKDDDDNNSRDVPEESVKVISRPALDPPGDLNILPWRSSQIIELFSQSKSDLDAMIDQICQNRQVGVILPLPLDMGAQTPEIHKIVHNGDPSNRIDVVFMGDGYTLPEKTKFLDDIHRLTKNMFQGQTFRSYLPLFNIWAIFVPSIDSGIGYDGPIRTPFKLFRERGQLRGIYPGNSSFARRVCQLTGPGGCDYPSIIGNDDYYGGLGGEFVISTRSLRSGNIVLRHEMGHNFVRVGEEYDNGGAYFGVNTADSLKTIGWRRWLSPGISDGPREEKTIPRILDYPWKDLVQGGPYVKNFSSDGGWERWYLIISVSGGSRPDSFQFILDNKILPWKSTGSDDRVFYDWSDNQGLAPGSHSLIVRSKVGSRSSEGISKVVPQMIASVGLYEFGSEEEYGSDNSIISAYPTWSMSGTKKYRPTGDGCLMRNMTHETFCNVCKEGMWHQFLQRVSLIDSLEGPPGNGSGVGGKVTLTTLRLGHLRAPGNEVPGEKLEVNWFYNGIRRDELLNEFTIYAAPGSWEVKVSLSSPEIRVDPHGLLKDSKSFTVV